MTLDGDVIVVTFLDERSHRVVVEDVNDAYELSAIVARQAALDDIDDAALRAWRRNRATQLLGFSDRSKRPLGGRGMGA